LKSFLISKLGNERGEIHVDGSVGETTGLRWLARATSASAPGGGSKVRRGTITEYRQCARKFFNQKRVKGKRKRSGRKGQRRLVKGVPTIHVDSVLGLLEDDSAEIEYHYPTVELGDFLTRQEFELLKRVKPHIGKLLRPRKVEKKIPSAVTERNRLQLAIFLSDCIARLYDLALREQDTPAKRWAGETLGHVFGWLKKRDKKLSANPSFKEAKSKGGKFQDPSLIRKILVEELIKAERYWWQAQNPTASIPDEYRCLRKLKSFPEDEEEWFTQCLWRQINKRAPELLAQLRKPSPNRVKYLKDCYGQFRDVSQSIARKMARSFTVTVAGTL
jgi:hypothetical protein